MGLPKILLVDDVKLFLEIEKKYLDLSAVTVLTAQDGEEALRMVGAEHPDLVILDVNMPKMDGVTCCSRIKQNPATRSIKVIMVSNVSRKEDIDQCWQAGCDEFLEKPVDGKLFLEKARKFIPSIERRDARVSCRLAVTCRTAEGSFAGEMVDISLHGVYVATSADVYRGEDIVLSFTVPGSATPIAAQGRVAWLNRAGAVRKPSLPFGFGVQVLEITGEGMALLRINELKKFIQQGQAS